MNFVDKLKKLITGFLVFAIMLSIIPSNALAKDWVEKHVKKAVVNKLTAIGLGAFGIFAGNIVKGIIDTYIDPGQWLAERIDGNDRIPNNGYIEVWWAYWIF